MSVEYAAQVVGPVTEVAVIPAQQHKPSPARVPELDAVRGLAIAFVLLFHYSSVIRVSEHSIVWYALLPVSLMWSGVDLFFVLSGFLIGGLLIDNRNSDRYYSVFYGRRIHRIFPIYYAMVALLFLGTWLVPQSPLFRGSIPLWTFSLYAQNLVRDFTRAPGWLGASWSLAVEEQFYLIFPIVVRLCSRKALLRFLGVCILGAPLLRALLILNGWKFENVHALLVCRADVLALGVLAAVIVRSENARNWTKRNSPALYLSLGALAMLLTMMLKWRNYLYTGAAGYSILGVTYFLLILMLLTAPLPGMTTFFRLRPLRWLGMVSYCVYLVHEPVLLGLLLLFGIKGEALVGGSLLKNFGIATLALAVTFAIAQSSWVLLESRLIKRAHRIYKY